MTCIETDIQREKERMRKQCGDLAEMVGEHELLTFVGKPVEKDGEIEVEVTNLTPEEYARAEPTSRLYDEFSMGNYGNDEKGRIRSALSNYNRVLDRAITRANPLIK